MSPQGKPWKRRALVAGVLAFFILAGLFLGPRACTPHAPYRMSEGAIDTSIERLQSDSEHRNGVARHSVELHDDFTLGFVEFDDQGDFFGQAQLDRLLETLDDEAERAGGAGLLTVVFVHGWKHNAAVCDQNVACFREVLRSLGNLERLGAYAAGSRPRRVVGVYLGWRGLSISPGPLRNFSFYGRKSTAHRVGGGRLREVLTRLEAHRDRVAATSERPSRLIVVGHSFGGAVVFSAVSGLFQDRAVRSFVRSESDGDHEDQIEAFCDLIVLVNPAFEASLYAGLHELGQSRDSYSRQQPTVLLTVSSESDSATGVWFPLGRFFGTLLQETRDSEQKSALRTTLGNHLPYRTHEATVAGARGAFLGDVQTIDAASRGESDCRCDYIAATKMEQRQIEEVVDFGSVAIDAHRDADDRWLFGNVELTPVSDDIDPYLPFFVVGASDEIVTEHNGIYNEIFVDFLRTFLLEMERRPERWDREP